MYNEISTLMDNQISCNVDMYKFLLCIGMLYY